MSPSNKILTTGDQLDHYRLERVLTQSAVATTYHAVDLRNGRAVFIKLPHPDVAAEPTFADWFRREQETMVLLDHPGVIKINPDIDQTQLYVVMEAFDGKLLREIMDEEKRLAANRATRIATEVCAALEYLHARGIVHGNLRPENILVGAEDSIKLVALSGAAKAKARRLTLTRVSQMAGASDYLSPEEVLGKPGDARSDLYALGLIFYEMLTARRPFPQGEPSDRLSQDPVPPRQIDASISPQLQEVIYRALERKPQNRYASAREFAHDLRNLDQVGVADRAELRNWTTRRSARLKKVLWYVAVALVPITVFILMLYFANR